ncbi:MAG: hypothetical protein ACR2P4_02685 [Gammaproteobacteria bacterium]
MTKGDSGLRRNDEGKSGNDNITRHSRQFRHSCGSRNLPTIAAPVFTRVSRRGIKALKGRYVIARGSAP